MTSQVHTPDAAPPHPVLTTHLAAAGGATTRQALNLAGVDDYGIALAVQRGQLARVRAGAYIDPACADTTERYGRTVAAVLRAHARPLLASHESAAVLLRLPLLIQPGMVQARSATRGTTLSRAGLRLRPLLPGDRDVTAAAPFADLRVADAAATALDLAASSGGASGLVAADAALRAGLCTVADLTAAAQRRASARYHRVLAEMVALASPLSESPAESRCRWLLHHLRVPQPVQQREIWAHGAFLGRVDFLFENQRLILEVDGAVKYTDRQVLFQEKRREDTLREHGYGFLRLTWRDLDHPLGVLRRLARCGITPPG